MAATNLSVAIRPPRRALLPSAQQSELVAFVTKFLLGGSGNTNILKTDGCFTFDKAKWVDWTVPSPE